MPRSSSHLVELIQSLSCRASILICINGNSRFCSLAGVTCPIRFAGHGRLSGFKGMTVFTPGMCRNLRTKPHRQYSIRKSSIRRQVDIAQPADRRGRRLHESVLVRMVWKRRMKSVSIAWSRCRFLICIKQIAERCAIKSRW